MHKGKTDGNGQRESAWAKGIALENKFSRGTKLDTARRWDIPQFLRGMSYASYEVLAAVQLRIPFFCAMTLCQWVI